MRSGKCLCGQVEYEISGEPAYCEACHCQICQKLSGGAFQIWMKCRPQDVVIKGAVRTYQSSKNVLRQSCNTCGSHLFFKYLNREDQIYITATSLEDPNTIKPNKHIWIQRKLSWLHLDDSIAVETT